MIRTIISIIYKSMTKVIFEYTICLNSGESMENVKYDKSGSKNIKTTWAGINHILANFKNPRPSLCMND